MEFFKSKYYIPLESESTTEEIAILKSKIKANMEGDWLTEILNTYMHPLSYDASRWKIDLDKVAECELVSDLKNHYIVPEEFSVNPVLYQDVYYDALTQCFFRIRRYSDSEHIATLYVPLCVSDVGVFDSLIERNIITYEVFEEDTTPEFGMLVSTMGGFDIRFVNTREIDIDLEGHYGAGFTEISDKILSYTSDPDKNGLIILHGLPGTGKTSYLRWLSGHASRPFVYIPTDIVGQLSSTAFTSFLMSNTGNTFIVEDAESVLIARDSGESNNHVAGILNMTDGIQGDIYNSQFICTFNTDLDKIDSALRRPGRLLIEHEFKALSVDNANRLLIEQGKDARVTEPTTLATLMNL